MSYHHAGNFPHKRTGHRFLGTVALLAFRCSRRWWRAWGVPVERAVDHEIQFGVLEENDFFFVLEEVEQQRRPCAQSRSGQHVGAKTRPAAVAKIGAVNFMAHADGGAGSGADRAAERRILGRGLLALATTLNRTLVILGSVAVNPALAVFEGARKRN